MPKTLGVIVLSLGTLGTALFAVDRWCPADIRPAGLRAPTVEGEAAAARSLAAVRQAHGAASWSRSQTMEVVFYDDWPFALTRIALAPWSEPRQKIRGRLLRRSWTTELELLDGHDRGERWGLQSWNAWRAAPDSDPSFESSWLVSTVVAGLRYFLELPLPQDTATFVQTASSAEVAGKTYERLYVTWNRSEPQRDFDQYLLWIDPDSGLVARVDFTVRALSGFAVARARFEDYHDVGGVKLASRITIDGVLPTGHTLPIHTLEVESRHFDEFEVAAIRPDPHLPEMGERKPDRR